MDDLGFGAESLIPNSIVFLLVKNNATNEGFNSFKKSPPHRVNFTLVSEISQLSWKVLAGKLLLKQLKNEIDQIKKIPRYSFLSVILFVSLLDDSFFRRGDVRFLEVDIRFRFINLSNSSESECKQRFKSLIYSISFNSRSLFYYVN